MQSEVPEVLLKIRSWLIRGFIVWIPGWTFTWFIGTPILFYVWTTYIFPYPNGNGSIPVGVYCSLDWVVPQCWATSDPKFLWGISTNAFIGFLTAVVSWLIYGYMAGFVSERIEEE